MRKDPRGRAKNRHIITDHALVQYMIRVLGLDVKGMKDHICPPGLEEAIALGAKSFKHEGLTYVIEGGVVITVFRGDRSYWKGEPNEVVDGSRNRTA